MILIHGRKLTVLVSMTMVTISQSSMWRKWLSPEITGLCWFSHIHPSEYMNMQLYQKGKINLSLNSPYTHKKAWFNLGLGQRTEFPHSLSYSLQFMIMVKSISLVHPSGPECPHTSSGVTPAIHYHEGNTTPSTGPGNTRLLHKQYFLFLFK